MAKLRARTPKNDPSVVYYGPHPCKDTNDGRKGCDQLIVKAGNGAPDYLEFNAQEAEGIIYPNTHKGFKWTRHKCAKK